MSPTAPKLAMLLLMIIVMLILTGCGDQHEPPPPTPAVVVPYRHPVPDNSQEGLDRYVRELEGYGGFYFLEETPHIVYVYMLDVTQVESAEYILSHHSVVRERGRDITITHMAMVQAGYSKWELRRMLVEAIRALSGAGITMTSGGVDTKRNMIEVGIDHKDLRDEAEAVLAEHGMPLDAIKWVYGGW